ncbi:multiheme c-type cytochrome [Campylobacter lari]
MKHKLAKVATYACLALGISLSSQAFASSEPRTLDGYVAQEDAFFDYLYKHHPIFKYEKEGRLVGKFTHSDRTENWVLNQNGAKFAAEHDLKQASITYRLPYESFLDFPNKFVGPKKCGECHPAQYASWERSRHAKTVRFPHEIEEVGGAEGLKKPMYNSQATILPDGIYPNDVYALIGTPRTKYGFIDRWLVRGTYHVEDGNLSDLSGKLTAGGNQFSRLWSEFLTPEMAQKIAAFAPGFPTKMEDFGGNGSQVWGTNSYAATYKEKAVFQPATAYCETCHTFKFDFKSKEEFYKALGNPKELQKHTISKGITCEECHGAGAHLYGARGAGMPSNCERCHQRFSYNETDAKINPRKPFNAYFKSSCPACGTEGAQMYSSAHYDKGMRCNTCHDPHEVTFNDWKSGYTKTKLKKTCKDCHETQASFFKKGGIHAKDSCTACHMPNMMSCENFGAVQNPDKGGFDNVRASHIWNIKVDKTAKTLNPPEGKERSPKVGGWTIARDDEGRFFLDLMWSCGRTSFSDINLMGPGASGCHSPVQSTLPEKLHFSNQEMIYDKVMEWQNPVKEGYEKIRKGIANIDKTFAEKTKLSVEQKSKVLSLTNQAQAIADRLEKDGSWGVHGPAYSKKIIEEALIYIQEAQNILNGK